MLDRRGSKLGSILLSPNLQNPGLQDLLLPNLFGTKQRESPLSPLSANTDMRKSFNEKSTKQADRSTPLNFETSKMGKFRISAKKMNKRRAEKPRTE